ncbi:hypothetical protein [Nitrosospira multiformis]|uniref:hypothetical protein n=1 Tax=Nitrosospira multiformis TaxID=1231 RepID=UPI001C3123AD|nr:hypothetical protein [Nitrosospira multiformis]
MITSSLFLYGCAVWSNQTGVTKIPADALDTKKTGVVILSTAAMQPCWDEIALAELYDSSNKGVGWLGKRVMMNHGSFISDFKTHYGTVSGLELKPGKYYFKPQISPTDYLSLGTKKEFDPVGFEVNAGEMVYIGELFLTNNCKRDSQLEVRDQYERDIEVAAKQNPSLIKQKPVKRLMELRGQIPAAE